MSEGLTDKKSSANTRQLDVLLDVLLEVVGKLKRV